MFAFPAAKRVRRADLYPPPASPEPTDRDSELTAALLHSQLERIYGLLSSLTNVSLSQQQQQQQQEPLSSLPPITKTTAAAADPDVGIAPADPNLAPNADSEELGFEFRLFATPRALSTEDTHDPDGAQKKKPSTTTGTTKRIILDADEDYDNNGIGVRESRGGFVVPRRDEGHYFTGAPAGECMRWRRRREFENVAVSGEEVRWWSGVRYSGWEVRWRVLYVRHGKVIVDNKALEGGKRAVGVAAVPLAAGLNPSRRGGRREGQEGEVEMKEKKGKPGKKRRIILRMRKRKGEELAEKRREEKEKKMLVEKEREAALREKRMRRNREKKVKKKMKEKAKKATAQGGSGLGNGEGGENSGGE